jgi:hypothetical protein
MAEGAQHHRPLGIDPALTALIRSKGMPNAVIAHAKTANSICTA